MKKVKLIQCVNAWAAVQGLMEQEWDYASAHALTQLWRVLKPQADFFMEEELKLAERYGKKGKDGQVEFTSRGTFLFQDPNQAGEYNAKRMELGGVEVELDWDEKTLPRPDRIRPVQLEALEGFVRFGGEDA